MITIELNENVFLHVHQTRKFKEVQIGVNFLSPLAEEERGARVILAFLLGDRCEKYPSKASVQAALDQLYGAGVSVSDEPHGSGDIFSITCGCVDSTYVCSDLLEQQFDVISQFLLHPCMEQGHFTSASFEEAKQKAETAVKMNFEDPSFLSCYEAAGLYGGILKKRRIPSVKDIESISEEKTLAVYHQILSHARIDIMVLGNVDAAEAERLSRKYLPFEGRRSSASIFYEAEGNHAEKTITRKFSQSFLTMLYETKRKPYDDLMPAFMIGNGILGALPTSLLFQEVREKRSLCYEIASENLYLDGTLQITTEMEKEHLDEAVELIREQIDAMKKGAFSDEMLEAAKSMYISSWKSSLDQQSGLLRDDYRDILAGREHITEDTIHAMSLVTREDVSRAFRDVQLCVLFRLQQEDDHHEEA